MSTQKVYPVYSFQYIQNKLVELSRQKLNTADVVEQVQADWTETDIFSPAYIKNKPTITPSPLTTKGDIYTRNGSADTRLPVGLDTQMLVADSSTATGLKWTAQPAATPTGYYGAWQDDNTQTAPSSNVGVPMILGTVDLSNGVTVVTDGTNLTRITFANTGIYNLQFSSQFQNSDNSLQDVTIWLRKNGSTSAADVAGSSGFISVPNSHGGTPGHTITSWNYLLDMVAGDYIQLIWSTTDHTKVSMQYYAAGSPPPSTASVIATVTQQAGIMAGTGITAINALTGSAQTLVTGTTGTDFNIASSGTIHTFNLPTASASVRGALSSADWTTFNSKQSALGYTPVPTTRTLTINGTTYDLSADRTWTISSGGMTNPMTTLGDIIYGGASGTPTRLGIGATATFLQVIGGIPAWFDLFATANTFTAMQTIQSNTNRVLRLNGVNSGGYASGTTITASAANQPVTVTNAQGIIFTHNESVNTNTYFPLFTFANRSLGGYVATVPEWQLRMFSPGSGSTGCRVMEITIPSSTAFTASQIAERWDIFQTSSSYAFKQHYLRTSIDTAGALNPASALLHIGANTTGYAQINLKTSAGTNPSAPADGDIWYDGTNLKMRKGATTYTITMV